MTYHIQNDNAEDCGGDSSSYERHPLASTRGAKMHQAANENEFQRNENAENYANTSVVVV